MLELRNFSIRYSSRPDPTVQGLSLRFIKGRITAILGPTGCGKSSILHGMLGIIDQKIAHVSGTLVENNIESILSHQTPGAVGIAFQRAIFFSWLNLYDNIKEIILASVVSGGVAKIKFELLDLLFDEFGLWSQRSIFPHQASGGMLARLNIIRAMCAGNRFLIIDESLSGVDEIMRDKIASIIQKFTIEHNIYTIIVTHNLYDASSYSDRAYALSGAPIVDADLIFCADEKVETADKLKLLKERCYALWYGGNKCEKS